MPHASDDGAPQATGLESRIAVLIDEIKKQLLRIEDDEGTLAEMTPDEELPAATLRAGCNEEVRLAAGNATHISVEIEDLAGYSLVIALDAVAHDFLCHLVLCNKDGSWPTIERRHWAFIGGRKIVIVLPCDKWHTLYPGVRTLKITLCAVPVAAISHHVAEQQLQATEYGSWSGLTASIDEPINHQSPTPAAAAAAASGAAVERVGASDDVVVRLECTLTHESDSMEPQLAPYYWAYTRAFKLVDSDRITDTVFRSAWYQQQPQQRRMDLTYGELTFSGAYSLLTAAAELMDRPGVFYDIGAGVGNAVAVAALFPFGFRRCVGIEIVQPLHAAAAEVWARIAADRPRPAEGAPWPAAVCDDVEFILGDLTQVDWADADVVYCANLLFSAPLMDALALCALKLRPGAIFVAMALFDDHLDPVVRTADHFEHVQCLDVEFTYGVCGIYVLRRKADHAAHEGSEPGRVAAVRPSADPDSLD